VKIRTKLVLLLSAALVATMVASTWARVRWTRQRLEQQALEQAKETASAIAADLEQHIKEDSDDDDISERLKFELRRHPSVSNVEFSFDSDEDTTVNFHLAFTEEEPRIQHTPRPQRKIRPAPQRRDDARRALADHGESERAPGDRMAEPLWRTPDRPESSRWAQLAARPPPAAKRPPKAFLVDLRGEAQKQGVRSLEVSAPVDPEGPRHGQLMARFSLRLIDEVIANEERVSALVTGVVLILLMIIAAVIVDRVVAAPVRELAEAMRRVEGGGLASVKEQPVPARRADEVGRLARGFNAMVERLSQADQEIRAFNRRLADEVRAATIDLARKNEALGQLNRLLVEARRELGDKERLAALGQLAAQLAHEIGTPLGSVSGHLQLAISARDVPPGLRERLGVATKELERVSKIVRDYLDSTRPVEPARVRCDLGRVIDEAMEIARGAAERPGLEISREVSLGAGEVETDPGLLRQILVNLLANAIDAVSGRGKVRVAVQPREGGVQIAVRDDGVGIAAEDAARIFEPFYTTKGRGKGTGLGLAICRELATALGGRITVESAPGAGSTFTMTLPGRAPLRSTG
jgi:signal transduction histidine kinase